MSEKQTRSKAKSEPDAEKKILSTLPKRHIFFIEDKHVELGQDIQIEKMRHPGTGESSFFVFSKSTNKVYEVHQFNEPHRSWFIDETVCSNGKCNLLTPFDPTLFALFYLYKNCSDKAMPLNQIRDDDFPKTTEILEKLADDMILKISDRKGPEDLRAFKFNKDKTLAWLALKTELLIKTLKSENIQVSENAISANYIKEEKDEHFEEDYLRFASGIVGSYIPEELKNELLEYLNVTETVTSSKRKSLQPPKDATHTNKKVKVEADTSIISPPPAVKEKKETAKEKAMKKAAAGTKSIASFFKK